MFQIQVKEMEGQTEQPTKVEVWMMNQLAAGVQQEPKAPTQLVMISIMEVIQTGTQEMEIQMEMAEGITQIMFKQIVQQKMVRTEMEVTQLDLILMEVVILLLIV